MSKKVALVIGNSDYGNLNVSGVEDAKEMAKCLREDLGFTQVVELPNGKLDQMKEALNELEGLMADASVVLFFYAGHGFQLDGENYLLPIDGDIVPERSISVRLDVLQAFVSAPEDALKFVFLDACRKESRVEAQGLASPDQAPLGILQAFAASPGEVAAAGTEEELSLYTITLLRHLREPGLKLVDLFERVRLEVLRDSQRRKQQPVVQGAIPPDFSFRPPVFIKARTFGWPDSPFVVLHEGKVVLRTTEAGEHSLQMNAGENHLTVLVSTGKTYHNGQVWGATEGWSYRMELELPGVKGGAPQIVSLGDSEPVPFKDGPHHGQSFVVAEATVFVDPVTAEVSIPQLDDKTAGKGLPFYADHQEILYQVKLASLGLKPEDVLGGAVDFGLAPLLNVLLEDFLVSGKILGTQVVNPNKVFVTVRGNRELRPVVEHCMTTGLPDRLRDIRTSFAAAFSGNPRPFDVYADGLNECIRAHAAVILGTDHPAADLRVWTSLEDPAEQEAVASESVEALGEPIEETLTTLLVPRPQEVLLKTRTVEQTVQGVPITVLIYTFLSFKVVEDKLKIMARAIGDLSDLQNKIGPLIDTLPLPKDNCSHFGVDNVVARIWGKQITIEGSEAMLRLSGDVEVWTCMKNPVLCTRVVWEEKNVLGAVIRIPHPEFYDCNPPIKNRNLTQPFDATLPFRLAVADADTVALKLGDPTVNLGGALGGVTQGILNIAGVDVNARVKEALEGAIHPDTLKQDLPDFLLKYNPTLTRAELVGDSGALAATLEVETLLDVQQLSELIRDLNHQG